MASTAAQDRQSELIWAGVVEDPDMRRMHYAGWHDAAHNTLCPLCSR